MDKRYTFLHGAAVLLLLACALLTGCGGGGADGVESEGEQAQLFLGDYWNGEIYGPRGTGLVTVVYGETTSDGAGMVTQGIRRNVEGVVIDSTERLPFPYVIDADRTLHIMDPLNQTREVGRGGIDATGDIAIAAKEGDPLVGVLAYVRTSAVISSTADLQGTYHMTAFARFGTADLSYVGTMTFDGAGGITFDPHTTNQNGSVSGGTSASGTYNVDPEGSIEMTVGATLRGRMAPSGQLIVLHGSVIHGEAPLAIALTPVSTAATESLLSGSYFFVRLLAGSTHTFRTGELVADGSGSFSMTWTATFSRLEQAVSGPFSYDVSSTGALTVNALETFEGGVSPDGSVFVLGGATAEPSSGPEFWLGIRK